MRKESEEVRKEVTVQKRQYKSAEAWREGAYGDEGKGPGIARLMKRGVKIEEYWGQ